jgi:hypothetical protein
MNSVKSEEDMGYSRYLSHIEEQEIYVQYILRNFHGKRRLVTPRHRRLDNINQVLVKQEDNLCTGIKWPRTGARVLDFLTTMMNTWSIKKIILLLIECLTSVL